MARLTQRLAPVLGLYRLSMRLNRAFWPMNAFLAVGLPVVSQAALSSWIDAAGRTRAVVTNVLLGLAMVTFRKAGILLTADRVFGSRELLAAAGVTRAAYLAAYALDACTLAVLPLGALAVAVAFLDVSPPASWRWIVPYAMSVALLFAAGVLCGARSRSLPAVALALNVATMGAIALCPMAYPAARAPAPIRPLVALLPPTLSADLMASAWANGPLDPTAVALLAGWTLLFGAVAWRRFE